MLPLVDAGALLPRSWGAAARLSVLLDRPAQSSTVEVEGDPSQIQLRQVQVRYPGVWLPALQQLDLDLRPGRCVAVVGPSGAGKSTLVRLLVGQLVADHGVACLGSTDLAGLGHAEISRHIVLAEQEAYLFDTSLADNLRLARPSASAQDLRRAVELAGLAEWVDSLPEGMGTPVGERGCRVSGGERKRLSVARALLSAAPVLLLDEPTEGLDPAAADGLVRRICSASPDRAVLVITHRLAALEAFDEVVVLDHGRVVQRGTAAALAGRPGMFRDLQRTQSLSATGGDDLSPPRPGPSHLCGLLSVSPR